MMGEYSGFTAYSYDGKDCFGLVDVISNMGDLSVYEVASNKPPYKAEIYFSGNDCSSLLTANPLRLTLTLPFFVEIFEKITSGNV